MNGSNGIQPTLELTTANGNNGYAYPVMPFYPNNNNDGFFGGDSIWGLVLLALLFSNGGFGFGGGYGMMNGMYEFPWLLNGQQGINTNVNNGFDNLHLSNQIEGARDGINNLATQICGSTADVVQAITGGFSNAEISANSRQMANMQQAFNSELNTTNGFNNLNNALQQCCCENRLASCQTQNIVQNEGNATRFADATNTRDIITNATSNTQAILDKLCQLELDGVKAQLDAKNDRIGDLQREILMKDLQASQVAQTADLRANNATVANQLVSELRSCPIPAQPVYGSTPIFQCNGNSGCGCGNQFI